MNPLPEPMYEDEGEQLQALDWMFRASVFMFVTALAMLAMCALLLHQKSAWCPAMRNTQAAVVALLILLGVPFFHIQCGVVDDRILPSSASTRQVQEVIRSYFAADEPHALHVVAADIATPITQQADIV